MARFTELTHKLCLVKMDIKEEAFDDFLQEYLYSNTKEDYTGLNHDCKTETCTSPIYKEEDYSPMEMKEEEESELREYGADGASETGKIQPSFYCTNESNYPWQCFSVITIPQF